MAKYLDETGLVHLWAKIKDWVKSWVRITYEEDNNNNIVSKTVHTGTGQDEKTVKVYNWALNSSKPSYTASEVGAVPTSRTVNGHALSSNITITAADIGVEGGAEVNQNAFGNIKVGSTTIAADAKIDTLELVAGDNVTLTPDSTNDKVTIAASTPAATANPLMDGTAAVGSSTKFAKEDHVHPTDTSRAPTSHASSNTTYGKGTNSNYGHVKLSDSTSSTTAAASGGTAATPKAVKDALDAANIYTDNHTIPIISTSELTSTTPPAAGTYYYPEDGCFYVIKIDSNNATNNKKIKIDLGGKITSYSFSSGNGWSSTSTEIRSLSLTYNNGWPYISQTLADGTVNSVRLPEIDFDQDKPGIITNNMWDMLVQVSDIGVANGICPLNASGLVDSQYLPGYVDDVIEAYPHAITHPLVGEQATPQLSENWLLDAPYSLDNNYNIIIPESGKIYVLMATEGDYSVNTQFRWSGSQYVKLNDGGLSPMTTAEMDTAVGATVGGDWS